MAFNLNKVILGGRLTADPEHKMTPNGISVVSFRMAVNRRYGSRDNGQQQEVDFFSVTAWRGTADFVAKYFKKGSAICVIGSIQNRTWTDQQGQKRYATDIVADEIQFVDSRNDSNASGDGYAAAPSFSTPAGDNATNFETMKTEDDLPF